MQFSFKTLTSVPPSGSIAPNERRVLKWFFGIEAADATDNGRASDRLERNSHQVVLLAEIDEVDQSELQDTPTVEVKRVVLPEVEEPLVEPAFVKNETPAEIRVPPETPSVATEPIPEKLTIAQPEPEGIDA